MQLMAGEPIEPFSFRACVRHPIRDQYKPAIQGREKLMRTKWRRTAAVLVVAVALTTLSACEKTDGAGDADTPATSVDAASVTATTASPSTTTTTTTRAPATTVPTTTAPPTTTTPPPPPPTTRAAAPSTACDPNYSGCVPVASDVDCAGGSGNGPTYTGQVNVIGSDIYDLDRDGDGIACE
jgi:hypothetical protein